MTARLGNFLILASRLQSVEALTATCTIHGFYLGISNSCKTFFGDGGIEERNIMQLILMHITCKLVQVQWRLINLN